MESSRIPLTSQHNPIGFINPGNTCFLNVAMQLILSISPLFHLSSRFNLTPCLNSIDTIKKSVNGRILEPNTSLWRVVELYLGYSPRAIRQNCACEFLRFFLVNLDEELDGKFSRAQLEDDDWVEVTGRNEKQSFNFRARGKSILYDLIGMTFKVQARAKGISSMTFQEELVISLQVRNTLSESLELYFEEGTIDEYLVEGVPYRCKTRTFIASFSPFLVFHIQRFKMENGRVMKVKKFINFNRKLKIPNKYLAPSLALSVQNGVASIPEYEVKAVVEHHGENANSGHYTCVVRGRQGWTMIDDRLTRPVSEDFVRNRNAYILLYQQVNREYL